MSLNMFLIIALVLVALLAAGLWRSRHTRSIMKRLDRETSNK